MPQDTPPAYPDEIDLLQLASDLWRKRALILLCSFISLAFGASYAFLAPEAFKAETRLLPPSSSDLAGLKSVIEVSPDDAFDLVNQNIQSHRIKHQLLKAPDIAEYFDRAFPQSTDLEKFKELSELISTELPNQKKNKTHTVVAVTWENPLEAAIITNRWVELALNLTNAQLAENSTSSLEEQIERIENKISSKKKLALAQIDAELLQLREARQISEKNGMTTPTSLVTENIVTTKAAFSNVMDLRALYLLGTKALTAEIEVLENRRKTPEKYAPSLSSLQEKKAQLQNINVDISNISAATIDSLAQPPEKRTNPKRTLILLISLILGGSAGVLIALVKDSLEQAKAKHSATQ